MIYYHKFEDHSEQLFGRQPDIDYLLSRIEKKGLTAIVGRPQMGKTWLLEQIGFLLDEQGYLSGYHESKGETDDHLLRVVMDLYRRWLSSASLIGQAKSIFERHRKHFIAGAGRLFGEIFAEIAPGIGPLPKILSGLSEMDRDLKTGGIELPSLDYDTALSLIRIVSKECKGKPIILIIDAWEKSPVIQKVYNTLESYLKHAEQWPSCHILLGIRDPELHNSEKNNQSYELVRDLDNSSQLVDLKRLLPMHLNEVSEQDRMLAYLKTMVPIADEIGKKEMLNIVDGFPGVIKRIRECTIERRINKKEDVSKIAEDAQKYRYREFDKLFQDLKGDELTMAIRIALFHRLTKDSWKRFRDVLCEGMDPTTWERLRESRVFESPRHPSYGHDSRHEAALNRFAKSRPESIKNELEMIVVGLASRIQYIPDSRIAYFIISLAGLQKKVEFFRLSKFHQTLCLAATSLLIDLDPSNNMAGLKNALGEASKACQKAIPLLSYALIKRGITKGQEGDIKGEISDYTAVIDMGNVPSEQRAMALAARGETKGQEGDIKGAISDLTALIDMEDAPSEQRAKALAVRGATKGQEGDIKGEISDYTAVIDMEDAPSELRAKALVNRGITKGQEGDIKGEISDYTAVIDMEDAPSELRAMALVNRGITRGQEGDIKGKISDYTAVIDMEDAPSEQRAMALVNRGATKGQEGDIKGKISDLTAVIDMEDAPSEQRAMALSALGATKGREGDIKGKISDLTAVIDMEDAPSEQRAKALVARGTTKGQEGDIKGAISDLTAMIDMEDAPSEQRAMALVYRGATKVREGDIKGAISDFTAVIDMEDAPSEQRAMALSALGATKGREGDIKGAISDFTAVIDMEGISSELRSKTLEIRGFFMKKLGDIESAIANLDGQP